MGADADGSFSQVLFVASIYHLASSSGFKSSLGIPCLSACAAGKGNAPLLGPVQSEAQLYRKRARDRRQVEQEAADALSAECKWQHDPGGGKRASMSSSMHATPFASNEKMEEGNSSRSRFNHL